MLSFSFKNSQPPWQQIRQFSHVSKGALLTQLSHEKNNEKKKIH